MTPPPIKRTSIIWFRRDLRVHDHPALAMALDGSSSVAAVFVIDDTLIHGRWPSPNRVRFMLESLRALDESLRERGGGLRVLRGRPAEVLPRFAAEVEATDVYVTRDYTPYARRRDAAVARALSVSGVRFHARPGLLVAEPEDVATQAGRAYAVFSPFRRRWEMVPRRAVLEAPAAIPDLAVATPKAALPSLAGLGLAAPTADLVAAGEPAARARLDAWAGGGDLAQYGAQRDRVDREGTSRLSQDLRWGLLSPVEVLARCGGGDEGQRAFAAELCWREFYYHVLWHTPRVRSATYQPRFQHLKWDDDPASLAAWQQGRTGYPVVDAAMRQLVATGWMHNRARMIVASFLTKDLLIDWRLGEAFFMRHLTDGDIASNNGGWQWAASTGTDPQPYFRIFNPTTQGKKFDPNGTYIRRWLPELASVPGAWIHEPASMPAEAQVESHCVIGRDYPAPIVEHRLARERALRVYGSEKDAASP